VEGIKESVLVKSSPNSELVDNLISTAASEQILRSFKASNIEYPLAVHLTGTFKTAFPNGRPEAKDEKFDGKEDSVKKTGNGEVILVGDTDLLNDKICVRIQNMMGRRVIQPVNGNLNFVQNLVEQFAGDDDLISSRSRASMSRPFTRVKEMEAEAGKQWQEKLLVLETKQRDMEQKIKELESQKDGAHQGEEILSPEEEKELEKYQATRLQVSKDLKQVRKNLRKNTDALEFWTKVINIGAVPAFVAISGLVLATVKSKKRSAK
jgi:ABC-type uncharacterized transport system involved in gliding motility auxiliary subunit